VLYDGTGSNVAVRGVGFQPDLIWGKKRNAVQNHWTIDAVRGIAKTLFPDSTDAEASIGLSGFEPDGFNTGTNSLFTDSGGEYVSWNWKANGSGSANTNGSIDSTVSVNTDAGFSIVTYTGDDTQTTTVGHGLSKAPEFIIVKGRSDAGRHWRVLANSDATDYLKLNTTAATADDDNYWNDTAPTATVFSIGDANDVNNLDGTFVAYCWHSVDGFSKVGGWTGNGDADGTFVYTGFRPKYLLLKAASRTGAWAILGTKRDTDIYNPISEYLTADTSSVEGTHVHCDFLSNGIKFRNDGGDYNEDAATYIYIAFAETPFKYANAR